MQILSAQQIRDWDEYTIQHEPITSIDLMERAALACFDWLQDNGYEESSFAIFCGKGNNGGDGLAIARLLSQNNQRARVYILEFGHKGTDDFQQNLARLHGLDIDIRFIPTKETIPQLEPGEIIIDALLGSGLNRSLEGLTAELVKYLNATGNTIISIDIPSGIPADSSLISEPAIKANHTLSFQCYKKSLLVAENEPYAGSVHILDIGLHADYILHLHSTEHVSGLNLAGTIYKPRKQFSHKGNFGHALIVAGAYGKMGAAVLAAKACLHTGVGLLTVHSPKCGYEIMQISVPEAMVITDQDERILTMTQPDINKYAVIGIGPGIGTDERTGQLLESLLNDFSKPMVIDADALNLLALNNNLMKKIPRGSVLTPHPKEFERLFGKAGNDFDRIEMLKQKAIEFEQTIILKGRYTCIATPSGHLYFNTTGNPGMATGGTGDVLTGMITALIAQGYSPHHAAILGVFLHGTSGDIAAERSSQESLSASDLIACIGHAFREIK